MKRLLLILALLLFSGHAEAQELAFLPHGGGGACPPANVAGSTIFPNSTCNIGPDQFGNIWGYGGTATLQTTGLSVNGTIEAQLNTANGSFPSKRVFYAFSSLCRITGTAWFMNGGSTLQASSPSASPLLANAKNNTQATTSASLSGILGAANPNDQIELLANPAGVPCWSDCSVVNDNGVTITFDTGVIYGNAGGCLGGKGNLIIDANNVTIVGVGTASEGYVHGGNVFGTTIDTNFTGLTVNGGTYREADTCIHTGGYNGTTTLENLTALACGAGVDIAHGQTHNIYVGTGQSNGFDTSTAVITNVTSYDTLAGGHLIKVRAPNITISQATLYCDGQTFSGQSNRACDMSYDIDMPCGAVGTVSNSVLERPAATENFGFASFGVEIDSGDASCGAITGTMVAGQSQITNIARNPAQHAFTAGIGIACATAVTAGTTITSITGTGPYTFNLSTTLPSSATSDCWPEPASMSMTYNQDIFIDDGPSPIAGSGNTCLVVNKPNLTYVNVVVQNSILVFNPASSTGALSLGCKNRLGVVAGTGNLCYASRTDAFGAGHDWPYVPPPLTGNPVPNGLEVTCPTT